MNDYTRSEISHLKWRLVTQEGLSPKQADERINNVINWKKNHTI